ncbi:MAG: ABC transporter permease [Bacteroidetes bacterium]|nr:ABC transporter permease [Bacteroidota bacterium]
MAKEKNKVEKAETLNAIVRRQFNRNRPAVWSLRLLMFIFLIGISADFIANEKPYYAEIKGQTYFPVLRGIGVDWGLTTWPTELSNVDWRDLQYDKVVWALVPYSPTTMDSKNRDYVGPFDQQNVASARWKHYLGTDNLGRDVLSGMIHGTTVAMMVGVVSMSVALLLGLFFGSLAGYYGDSRLKMTRLTIVLNVVALPFAMFYAFSVRSYTLTDAMAVSIWRFTGHFILSLGIFAGIMAIPNLLDRFFKKIPYLGGEVSLPIDILVSRLIEILESIPSLLLLLSIVAIIEKPSLMIVMVIIGLTRWTGIARYLRGELLRVRSLEYVEAAQALGYPEWRIILRHTLPNSLTSVLISVSFGIASAILTESSLSFLGIGVPPEQVTWGSMLSLARGETHAWWVAIFPGFAIFITVTIFNLIGDGLTEALDPRLKQ